MLTDRQTSKQTDIFGFVETDVGAFLTVSSTGSPTNSFTRGQTWFRYMEIFPHSQDRTVLEQFVCLTEDFSSSAAFKRLLQQTDTNR